MNLQKIKYVDDFVEEETFVNLFDSTVVKQKPIRYVEFDCDPLAYIVKWLESNVSTNDIYTWFENKENINETVTDEHIKTAEEIRSFFNNSIMIRRLKGQFISPFMNAVEELNSTICKVNVDHIKILIKLPFFYKESIETRDLFAKYRSLDNKKEYKEVDNLWRFVKKIERHSKNEKFWRYYFSNDDQNLLCMKIMKNSDAKAFLDYIISQGPIGIKGSAYQWQQPGHDFCFYRINNYELYSVYTTTD